MKTKLLLLTCLIIASCTIPDDPYKGIEPPQDGEQGQAGYNSLIKQSRQDECILIETGLDFNRNDSLDENEVASSELLCAVQGENGLTSLFNISKEDNCITIVSGLDTNRNGVLDEDEITQSETICAVDGEDGNPGEDGSDGNNGSDGSDGKNTLVRITNSTECDLGGVTINVGLDDNEDNVLQDEEIQQSTDICQIKCVKNPECKYEVYDTKLCGSGILYSFWLDGKRFSNISLKFRVYADNTARLWGKIAQHGNDDLHTLDIWFTQGQEDEYKEPNCIDEEVTPEDWIQYTELSGTLTADYTGHVFELSRRGEATQFGIGANPENQFLALGFSGWVYATNHTTCNADINILLEEVCD